MFRLLLGAITASLLLSNCGTSTSGTETGTLNAGSVDTTHTEKMQYQSMTHDQAKSNGYKTDPKKVCESHGGELCLCQNGDDGVVDPYGSNKLPHQCVICRGGFETCERACKIMYQFDTFQSGRSNYTSAGSTTNAIDWLTATNWQAGGRCGWNGLASFSPIPDGAAPVCDCTLGGLTAPDICDMSIYDIYVNDWGTLQTENIYDSSDKLLYSCGPGL